ncbi:MAG: hypothetical protein P1V81_11075 [Planctomycetota bacterium]|nr:hypothetical protein [Planctomycetota bacterium]
MKHTGSLTLGLGLMFGLPAFTLGGGLPDSVSSALGDTMRALEVLKDLERELNQGVQAPAGTIERITDAPIATPVEREERLVVLRDEVSMLQGQVDAKRLREGTLGTGTLPMGTWNTGDTGNEPSQAPIIGLPATTGIDTRGVTTGLSETFIRALGSGEYGPAFGQPMAQKTPGSKPKGATAEGSQPASASGTKAKDEGSSAKAETTNATPARSPEGKGYSANHMRQAKACFRAARYQQGIDILTTLESSAEVDYWHARCLEKLGLIDEAVALYQVVEVADDAGILASSAKRDREFAEWRREFERKSGIRSADKEGSQ